MVEEIKSFIINKFDEMEPEEGGELQEIVDAVKEKFKTECKYFHAGGFDSPGYDIDCYVIAFLDESGKIQGVSVDIESY